MYVHRLATCGPVLFCKKDFVHSYILVSLARLVTEDLGCAYLKYCIIVLRTYHTTTTTRKRKKNHRRSGQSSDFRQRTWRSPCSQLCPEGKDKKQSDQGLVAKMLGFSPRMDHLPIPKVRSLTFRISPYTTYNTAKPNQGSVSRQNLAHRTIDDTRRIHLTFPQIYLLASGTVLCPVDVSVFASFIWYGSERLIWSENNVGRMRLLAGYLCLYSFSLIVAYGIPLTQRDSNRSLSQALFG